MSPGWCPIALGILLALFQPAHRTEFRGTWQLDLTKSTNLPESFKHVDSYSMEIRQTKDSLILVVRLVGNGQDVKFPMTSYLMDGTEVFREDTLRLSRRWSKATWGRGGKQLIVESRVEQGRETQSQRFTQRDVWELVKNNTLQISMRQEFRSGKEPHVEQRIFHRAK